MSADRFPFAEGFARPVAVPAPPRNSRWISGAILFMGDVLVLTAILIVASGLRHWANRWFPIEISAHMFAGVLLAVLFLPLGFAAAQLYPGYGLNAVERLRKRVTVSTFGFGAMILFDYLAQDGQWSRGILLTAAAMAVAAMPLWDETAIKFLVARRIWGEPVVVIGPRERRHAILAALGSNPELGWVAAAEAESTDDGHPPGVEVALLALPLESMRAWLGANELPYRRVVLVPEIDCPQTQWVTARSLGPHLALQIQQNLLVRRNQMLKRGLDVVAGSMLLAAASPVILVAAALVWAVSPGPVFYGQVRTGRDGTPFRMWKLRTMVLDAEDQLATVIAASEEAEASWHKSVKIQDDPRVLPWVGNLLRRFSVDELPQFWNVVRGEMSLVGPRPLPSYHTERLAPLANRVREKVRPGITGLWQVSGRSDNSNDRLEQLDVYYVRNWSLWLDMHILARTVGVVLTGKGAR